VPPDRLRRKKLRTKIVSWTFVPTALVLVGVTLVSIFSYRQVTEELVIERDRQVIRLSAQQLATELEEYSDSLSAVARTDDISAGTPEDKFVMLQQSSSRLAAFDGGTIVLDTFGVVVAAYPQRTDALGADWSDRPYYRAILRNQIRGRLQPVFSSIVQDGPGSSDVIVLAVPVIGESGEFAGALAGMFRLGTSPMSAFYSDLVRLRVGAACSTYLVDEYGEIIYRSDCTENGASQVHLPAVEQVLSGQVGAVKARDVHNHEIVASFAPVPGTPWGLVAEEYWSVLTETSREYLRFLLLLLLAGVAIPVLVVTVAVRRITQPITELIHAAQEVARGRFSTKISASTGDEIEELALQFNVMSEQLQQSYSHLEERVASRTSELRTINDIASVVSRSLNLDEIVSSALERTTQAMRVEAGGIYLHDSESDALQLYGHRGLGAHLAGAVDLLARGEGFSGRVAELGEPIVVEDLSTDERLSRHQVSDAGFRSLASVPLVAQGDIVGTLFVLTRFVRQFDQSEIALMVSIGQQIGVAVQNAHLYAQAGNRLRQLDTLYRADEELYRYLSLEKVLGALVDVAVDILGVDKSFVLVCDSERQQLVIGAQRGFAQNALSCHDLSMGSGPVANAITNIEPLIVENAPETPGIMTGVIEAEGIASFISVPIVVNGQVFGLFGVNYVTRQKFDADDRRLVLALAQRVARAIENAQLYEQDQELAAVHERQRLARDLHDAVTQTLFSASLIAEVLPRIWERDQQQGLLRLEELRQLTRGALAEMRTLLLELRPTALIEADLRDLLKQLAEATMGRSRIPVTLVMEGDCDPVETLAPDVKVAIYRVAQEALNNMAKHSSASHATVHLDCSAAGIELRVVDDGRGFLIDDVPPDHLGLGIMRERAQGIDADIQMDTTPGQGATIRMRWHS